MEILRARDQAALYPDPIFPGAFGLYSLVHFVTECWRINPEIVDGEQEMRDMLTISLNLVERALAAPGWRDRKAVGVDKGASASEKAGAPTRC